MQTKKKKSKNKQGVRLVEHIVPIHYEITLKPDLDSHTFSGSEVIQVNITKTTQEITLHSNELDITSALILLGKEKIQSEKIQYNLKDETATLVFKKRIPEGKHKIALEFRGILNDHMRGFYKSRYHVEGEERIMATTQFEATDARRCIPCFDEPAQKAVFTVTLIVPTGKEAVSNTLPVSVIEHGAGYKAISFAPTPKMSTYLLAFLVGDFEYLQKKTKKGVLVRIITTPGKKEQGKFALDVAIRCLDLYEDYFAIAYPLNTLDMIAIPDFESAAMENWGAITYRETQLLVDEAHSSVANRLRIAIVIAHEIAHQWFGNLVTMEWWRDLWLNEGFASYIEYLAVDKLFPKWNIWSQFLFSDHSRALRLDSLESTHPIEVEVHNPNQIGEIFDAVSYSKGASIIRALASYLGEKDFRDGLRFYLKKHSYKNAETTHLWEAFEKISKKPVRKIMEQWTKKPGYPILSFAPKGSAYEISQTRFFANPRMMQKKSEKTIWDIPFAFATDRGVTAPLLLSKSKNSVETPKTIWYKPNASETGFYRNLYTKEQLTNIALPIQNGRMSEYDRLGVIRDLFATTEAGYMSVDVALDFLQYYQTEQSYIVWVELCNGLMKVSRLLDKKEKEQFARFAQGFIDQAVSFVGLEPKTNEEETMVLLRSLILSEAGYFGHKNVVSWAKNAFKNKDKIIIDPNLRSVIYGIVARFGSETEFKKIVQLYKSTETHQEKLRLLSSLGNFQQKKLLQEALDFSLSSQVRLQDRIYLFGAIAGNTEGTELAWNYMTKRWSKFGELVNARMMFGEFVKSFMGMKTDSDAKAIKSFFKKHPSLGIERAIEQTLERITINAQWVKRDQKKVYKWLMKHGS